MSERSEKGVMGEKDSVVGNPFVRPVPFPLVPRLPLVARRVCALEACA